MAGAGDGAGRLEADGGEQGTPAEVGARSCWRYAAGAGGALYVVVVAGVHQLGVCATVQQVRRAGAAGWVQHRVGDGAAGTGTCRRAHNCIGNRTGALTAAGDEWIGAGCSRRCV